MIKEGDYLVCKKNFIINNKIYLEKGKTCKILSSGPNNILTSHLCLWFNLQPSNHGFYIWDYFYTLAEWREQQINSILEDD